MKIKNLFLSIFGGLIIFLGLSSFCSSSYFDLLNIDCNNTDCYMSGVNITNTPFDCGPNSYFVYRGPRLEGSALYVNLTTSRTNGVNSGYNCTSSTPQFSTYGFGTYMFSRYFSYYDGGCELFSVQFKHTKKTGTYSYTVFCEKIGENSYSQVVYPFCPTCSSSSQFTSEECQSEYGLVSSGLLNQCNSDLGTCQSSLSGCQSSLSGYQLDLQSCQASLSGRNNTLNNCSNNLLSCESSLASCIQSNCPIDTGSVMRSSIWINGIQHLGKPVINIDIPSNIYWDYTTNDEQFDLYIGSGYDQEYIDGVIAVNSYRPSSEDFTSAFVGGLTLVFPYIIIALFIIFVRKLIKRIFK